MSGGPQPVDGSIGTSTQVTSLLLLQQARPGPLGTGGKMTLILGASLTPDAQMDLIGKGTLDWSLRDFLSGSAPCPQGLSVPGSFLTVEEVSWMCMLAEFHNRVNRW